MRYKELLEVNHNPDVVKIDYDTLQTLISLGLGDQIWDIGYADVNNYVALIGSVGHGIGEIGGVQTPNMQDPDSDTKAIVVAKDYGDDADKIAGAYSPATGEVSINIELLKQLKPGVKRIESAKTASTIVHEMMHRGFDIISKTPELISVMPEDIKGYWLDDWGKRSGKYYFTQKTKEGSISLQASAEHAMIYTHEMGASRFKWTSKGIPWETLIEYANNPRTRNQIAILGSMGLNILYCRIDSVSDKNSPIYGMRPLQIYNYWREQFDLVNEGLKGHFQQSGPSRRLTKGGYEKGRKEREAERDRKEREAKRKTLGKTDLSRISNTAARLMGQTNTLEEIQSAVDSVFKDLPVSSTWRTTVAETIRDLVEADDSEGLNKFISKLESILAKASK